MEPKKLLLRWTGSEYRVSEPNIDTCHIYLADDPAIVQSLAIASAAREAGLVDEQGRFRKILGTLPITADGCVAGLNCTLWRWNRPAQEMMRMELFHADRRSHLIEPIPSRATICVDLCYSTRSAAEAAKGGGDAQ